MLISQNGDREKPDNSVEKMNTLDLNNVDAIREKKNSLNAQKIKNINNIMNQQKCSEKENTFCNDELKKHVSILCKYGSLKISTEDHHHARGLRSLLVSHTTAW